MAGFLFLNAMLSLLLPYVFFITAAIILARAAWDDLRRYEIPNHASLTLIGIFIAGAAVPDTVWPGINIVSGLVSGGAVFAAMMIFYLAGAMGGGDTKLAGATALVVGTSHVFVFLLVMTCVGGLMAMVALAARHSTRFLPRVIPDTVWPGKLRITPAQPLPYGVAVAVGGMAALGLKWLE